MATSDLPSDGVARHHTDAMAVFFAWEKLRIAYNLVLVVVVVLFALTTGKSHYFLFWLNVAWEALIANVCFCAGPVSEGYLHWLGYQRPVARWLLFVNGLLLSVWMAHDSVQSMVVSVRG
jgi:hypothetical protein